MISVIVPHFNDLAGLDRCLDALSRQTLSRDRFEVIVADNRSTAGAETVEAVIADRARFVDAPVPGAGPARNSGAAQANGDIFAFTDCDCVPDPGWLAAGTEALEKADLVGGRMTVLVPDSSTMSGAEAFESVFAFNNRRYVTEEFFTITANMFCSRKVFEAVGPFRTAVSEDKEWCLRARDRGFHIGYAEKAVVGHPARRDWSQLKHKWRRIMAESHALAMDRGGGHVGWLLRTWALIPSIPVHMIRILFTPAISRPKHRAAAIATLVRLRLWRFAEGHRLAFAERK